MFACDPPTVFQLFCVCSQDLISDRSRASGLKDQTVNDLLNQLNAKDQQLKVGPARCFQLRNLLRMPQLIPGAIVLLVFTECFCVQELEGIVSELNKQTQNLQADVNHKDFELQVWILC